jgi:hypothetical protein
MSSSPSVQLPYAAVAAPPPHGEEGRSTRRSLLRRVMCCTRNCNLPIANFGGEPLFLPRGHRIETEAALRDPGNCKLFFLFCSSLSIADFSQ